MVDLKASHGPTISYRPIRPSDREVLEQIHGDIFPIRYEAEFFQNVVNGRDIVSWGAVDRSRSNGQSDELIGFVTARIVLAKESEIGDMLRYDSVKSDQTLVYILTLGVVESYRNLGIAIHLYKKMSFKCVRRLHDFYLINGQHYDSYLFVYYVNGGQSPCSLLELARVAVTHVRSGLRSLSARLWKNEEKKGHKRFKYKETCCLVTKTQNKRVLTTEATGYDCV
ncbi:histone acetyltransferase MCC1 isoform X2 [Malania oleifera]|uniref:histone acetyltransferase MCC1 isoform X2 n=1 Tax=Malania oleifera TaxID=397392 RepID=UPI0025AEB1B1|nr:histone acetyltransferase MCC1 isoform X2 [Malania oleifera]XP_057970069.1 histone acetyltransferase MCC1 isoform X2 [Malania oleifera]XP_057970071.1 histone acetyltransferase MCC1 isoform X2 [Malania oleifera]XP_057970072.1 histone acetyltransferase MCC1 isoform X2 [Malania oleifera]XP_057970073.1 histone acetyltransferase MCC1 isoform X2 [Malania oleifera]